MIVFSSVGVAWSGGFLIMWLYSVSGFLDIDLLGANLRELFQLGPVNVSVAIWVGFLALFGIATDNGVVTATYLDQTMARSTAKSATTSAEIRDLVVEGASRRIRPALITTATTMLCVAAGTHIYRPWFRHHGAHGDSVIWWHAGGGDYNLAGTGAVLRCEGVF